MNIEATLPRPRLANLRQAYDLALAGAVGALCGLYLYVELVHADSVWVRDGLAGAMIGGAIGFFLNASAPSKDGAWLKLAREATWGVVAGGDRRGDRAGGGRVGPRRLSGGTGRTGRVVGDPRPGHRREPGAIDPLESSGSPTG